MGIEHVPYGSWQEFKASVIQDLFEDDIFRPGRFVFRGMGSDNWPLVTSFDRQFDKLPALQRVQLWERMVHSFSDLARRAGVDGSTLQDEPRLLALGQHYGLPTRLLDWTESPYVASFFAFRRALTELVAEPGRVAVWALDTSAPIWSRAYGVELYKPEDAGQNERLRRQGGTFTHSRTTHTTLEDYVDTMQPAQPVLWKFTVAVHEAAAALADLDAMGINAQALFPDLTGVTEAAALHVLVELFRDRVRPR
ncbi:FRG domain-containing protein [Geodermatophilus amargosae]|uniref:FRG domain-containing protein n=1 Tax=Geodermatophilus amargosae TaxID=1296565 RepID=A0A1I6X5E6_9ACTN|nr:FRG domain-containing protein [Geodermatophilus amargosae]SFT33447.1 FRG domain-containing protein [Geodermatophilus amargosae]